MVDDRLSHLGILSFESRTACSLNMDEVVKHFASSHQNRRIVLFLNLPWIPLFMDPSVRD